MTEYLVCKTIKMTGARERPRRGRAAQVAWGPGREPISRAEARADADTCIRRILIWMMDKQRIIPLIVAAALFMENMDSTVIATSLPAIAVDIGTSPLTL
jgi:hypothetical protein